jgi:hypothetical protein
MAEIQGPGLRREPAEPGQRRDAHQQHRQFAHRQVERRRVPERSAPTKITPVTATPSALPTFCILVSIPEAAPARSGSSDWRIVEASGASTTPMPAPTSAGPGTSVASEPLTPMPDPSRDGSGDTGRGPRRRIPGRPRSTARHGAVRSSLVQRRARDAAGCRREATGARFGDHARREGTRPRRG